LGENDIKERYIKAFNSVFKHKDEIIENCEMIIPIVGNTSEIDKRLENISKELDTIATSVLECVKRNARETISQDEYMSEYNKLTSKYEKKVKQKEKLIAEKEDKLKRITEIKLYIQKLNETDGVISEWDDSLWTLLVDKAVVNNDGTTDFYLKDGNVISV